MHILIIPSEEFMPSYNKTDGIFQHHQAVLLKEAGHRVSVLSIKLSFSVPMILKGLFFKLLRKKAGNAADGISGTQLLKLGYNRLLHPQKFIEKDEVDGLAVYRIEGLYRRPPQNLKNHVSWVKAGLSCFEECLKKEGRPDVIHAHNAIYAGMLAQKIHEAYGIPYIITEHSSIYALGEADEPVKARARSAYKSAKGLFAVSEAFAAYLNGLHSFNRFRYLPNVLDRQLETHPYRPVARKEDKFVFLHIASLIDVKDQQTLLKAYKKLTAKNKATELWIGGDGELKEALKEQVNNLDLQDSVSFLGKLNRNEVISRLQSCDCFVLSSKYETFGVVLIEAMLFGKPVVVTKVGVGQGIINEKTGFVVDTGNAEQLAEAMLEMSLTRSLYDPEYIRSFTIASFGKAAFLQQIEKIYNDVTQPVLQKKEPQTEPSLSI